ncbi:MAG: hypothetical protein ABI183_02075 [Polyangiaceae bacterium]
MAPMFHVPIGRGLSPRQKTLLEERLEHCLGPVSCVRHPPAIDHVGVVGDDKNPQIVVSACCELTSRRAKILIAQVLSELT